MRRYFIIRFWKWSIVEQAITNEVTLDSNISWVCILRDCIQSSIRTLITMYLWFLFIYYDNRTLQTRISLSKVYYRANVSLYVTNVYSFAIIRTRYRFRNFLDALSRRSWLHDYGYVQSTSDVQWLDIECIVVGWTLTSRWLASIWLYIVLYKQDLFVYLVH